MSDNKTRTFLEGRVVMQYQYCRVLVAMFFFISVSTSLTKAQDEGVESREQTAPLALPKVYTNKFPVRILDVPSESHPEVKSTRFYYGLGKGGILEHIKTVPRTQPFFDFNGNTDGEYTFRILHFFETGESDMKNPITPDSIVVVDRVVPRIDLAATIYNEANGELSKGTSLVAGAKIGLQYFVSDKN